MLELDFLLLEGKVFALERLGDTESSAGWEVGSETLFLLLKNLFLDLVSRGLGGGG